MSASPPAPSPASGAGGPADTASILAEVGDYYTGKLKAHGPTARGVDWRDAAGQERRFAQLLRAVPDARAPFTLAEVGCGYGALARYLADRGLPATYVGCDVSEAMIESARRLNGDLAGASFVVGREVAGVSDHVVASGIFNVRFGHDDATWLAYVDDAVDRMVRGARVAASFNALTGYADAHRKEPRLWYPDPGALLARLTARYGFRVALLHDYDLYEFTISIRAAGAAP